MWSADPAFLHPDNSLVLWRYLSTEKFLSLLGTKKLHLARLDQLDDPWEGVLTAKQEEEQLRHGSISATWNAVRLRVIMKETNKRVYVNCWHPNEHESAAMWDLYASRHAGVALKTTVGSLKSSINSALELRLISVQYIDHHIHKAEGPLLISDWTTHTSIAYKRKSFVHEQEVRLVYIDWAANAQTPVDRLVVELDVCLRELLTTIYVAPTMPGWQVEALRRVTEQFDFDPSLVKQSSLYDSL